MAKKYIHEELALRRKIRNYMLANYEDSRIPESPWEISPTKLAEDAAINGFDKPEWLDDETHLVWDVAVEVSELLEAGEVNEGVG